jgi:hypothetical protein
LLPGLLWAWRSDGRASGGQSIIRSEFASGPGSCYFFGDYRPDGIIVNNSQALHSFARQYCIARFQYWSSLYAAMVRDGRNRVGSDYTDEAYGVFPKYNVLSAILHDIETLDFDALPDVNELKELLILCARTASSDFTVPIKNSIHQNAISDERENVAGAIEQVSEAALLTQSPMFYRRVLSSDEVAILRSKIEKKWGAGAYYWYPLSEKTHPSLVAFNLLDLDEKKLQMRIQEFFAENSIKRIFELREGGRETYEVDAGAYELFYSGLEGYWLTNDNDWIIYCSHEQTMTFGGTICIVGADK